MELANLIKIISAVTRINYAPGAITEEKELVKDLRMDSLDIAELSLCLEDETGRDFTEVEGTWKTVGDVLTNLNQPA